MPSRHRRATASRVQKPKNVVVATHGHCFDGMASAAVFNHLLRSIAPKEQRTFRYRSCGYGPGMSMIPEAWLDGDENAILDFRYTKSSRLTWFFDHHVTGFGSVEEQNQALEQHASNGPTRVFYEPTYTSCTKLIADIAAKHFDVSCKNLEPLITWAEGASSGIPERRIAIITVRAVSRSPRRMPSVAASNARPLKSG